MQITLSDGVGTQIFLGERADVTPPFMAFASAAEAEAYLRRLADTTPEIAMLRDLMVRTQHVTMMLSDDAMIREAARAVMAGSLLLHETPPVVEEALRKGIVERFGDLELQAPKQRPPIGDIMARYKVAAEAMVEYTHWAAGDDKRDVTVTEKRILDQLDLGSLYIMKRCKDAAYDLSRARLPTDMAPPAWVAVARIDDWRGNDGHRDALRHSLWNALMASELGPRFARTFATAHEGVPGNQPARMAMDLWNNQLGRRVYVQNRTVVPERLADLLKDAVLRGEATVIDRSGNLAWSDQVKYGEHGLAPDTAP